ncbi:uncharacterized protein V1518DRAFT_423865 [Limtongia smithiae]|uniref:uncharacterized protein n=1 Tax=Limtongia smithiae TaxID=1125753 RepID=UPI0034CFD9AD
MSDPVLARRVFVRSALRQAANIFTRLLSSAAEDGVSDNRLSSLLHTISENEKQVFVSLNYLLPTKFLKALAVFDTGKIQLVQFSLASASKCKKSREVYRIRVTADGVLPVQYEYVRPQIWSCSCAIFAQSAFTINDIAPPMPIGVKNGEDWLLMVGECPHVIACYLARLCGRDVGVVEDVALESLEQYFNYVGINSF